MAVHVRYIKAIPWPGKGWRIQWSVGGLEPTDEIVLERSSSPEGPWDEVALLPYNVISFEDEWPTNRSFFSEWYYRIRVGSTESVPVCSKESGSLVTNEIIRQHEAILKGMNGRPGYMSAHFAWYKRTLQGTKCHYCRDKVTGEIIISKCDVCKGVGYIEGWSNPGKFYGRWLTPIHRVTQLSNFENEEEGRTMAMAAYPIIEPGDVLAEKGTGKVYRVRQVTSVEPNNIVISQNIVCSLINRDFIESKLEFPE